MGYKSPERIGPSHDNRVGAAIGGIGTLLQLLDQSLTKTKTEADTWYAQIGNELTNENSALNQANNSGFLYDIEPLLDNQLDLAENWGDILDDPKYDLQAKTYEEAINNKRNLVNSFESAVSRTAEHRLNPYAVFDISDFYWTAADESENKDHKAGTQKTDQDWMDSFQNWHNNLNGAPIIWDLSNEAGYDTMSDFINLWANMVSNPNISEDLKNEYSILNVINKGNSAAQNNLDSFLAMGLTFDNEGRVSGNVKNLQKDWEINYQDKTGNSLTKNMTLEEVARQAWDTWRDYSNLSYAITQQTVAPKYYQPVYNAEKNIIERVEIQEDIQIVNSEEVMLALTSTPGSGQNQWKAIVKKKQDDYTKLINNSLKSMTGDFRLLISLQKAIDGIDEGLSFETITDSFSQGFKAEDVEDVNMTLGTGGYQNILNNINSRQYLSDLAMDISNKVSMEKTKQSNFRAKAAAWGSSGAIDLDFAAIALELKALGVPNVGVKRYQEPTVYDVDAEKYKQSSSIDKKEIKKIHDDKILDRVVNASELDNELIHYIFSGFDEDDYGAASPGRMWILKDGDYTQVNTIDYSNPENRTLIEDSWNDPQKLVKAVKDMHQAQEVFFEKEDINKYSNLRAFDEVNSAIADGVSSYTNEFGENFQDNPRENMSQLKALGTIERNENNEIIPAYMPNGILVPTVMILEDDTIEVTGLFTQNAPKETRIAPNAEGNLSVKKGDVFRIVYMSDSSSYVPSRNLKGGINDVSSEILNQGYSQDSPIFNSTYVSSLGEGYNTDDMALVNYMEANSPSIVIILDERGNLYQVLNPSNQLFNKVQDIYGSTTPSINIGEESFDFNLLNWKLPFDSKDFSQYPSWLFDTPMDKLK